MGLDNFTMIGTSHIAKESLDDVKDSIENSCPDIVALELDRKRLAALMSKGRTKTGFSLSAVMRIGIKGFIFSLIGAWIERKLGEYVGVAPGSEMMLAAKMAMEKKIRLFLIDRDIDITLKRLSKELTWKEKMNFVVDVIKGLFSGKKAVGFDLRKVPNKDIIKKFMAQAKDRYPSVFKVLVDERNDFMARRISKIMVLNPESKILAVMGAGHVDEVRSMIKARIDKDLTYSITAS